jgi:hypothetical protein
LDATKKKINSGTLSFERDASKMPLFPHEPSVNDISQRMLGDCYLLAGLASVVTTHPEKIKECMRDNQDGTVTVRFYDKQAGAVPKFTPVYVTVTKQIPRVMGLVDTFASNCLWAQMIERAYAASGLHFFERF